MTHQEAIEILTGRRDWVDPTSGRRHQVDVLSVDEDDGDRVKARVVETGAVGVFRRQDFADD